jgi:hypothetical protein
MKRRQALQTIALTSGSLILMPYCTSVAEPVYDRLPISLKQKKLVGAISNAILPENPTEFSTPESRQHFVLLMVNDTFNPGQIDEFIAGLIAFENEFGQNIDLNLALNYSNEELKKLISTIKRFSIQHFTTSMNFMQNYLQFEFIPGRFKGCISL